MEPAITSTSRASQIGETPKPTTYWSQSYDFALTPQMWADFAWEANERGLMFKMGTPAIILFIGVGIWTGNEMGHDYSNSRYSGPVAQIIMYLLCGFMTVIFLRTLFSPKYRRHIVLESVQQYSLLEEWFAIVPPRTISIDDLLQSNAWTPCRLTISTYGVQLDRFIGARTYHTRVPWATLRKATDTDGMIILRPAVTHQFQYHGIGRGTAYDIRDCVLVDRRAVPNPEAFTQWCQTQIDNARKQVR